MAQSSIITSQYVEITQTPASVGERLLAAIIDWVACLAYLFTAFTILANVENSMTDISLTMEIACNVMIIIPVIFYNPACEIFARGQSIGKRVMKMRVVMADGDSPTVGSCLLRWLLYPIDTIFTGFLGVVFITFGKHRQRLGDLAAGTMVIKKSSSEYNFYTLGDYSYVQQGYVPTYPAAANLSSRQVDVITRTLYNTSLDRRNDLIYKLAVQVQQYLEVPVNGNQYADEFLKIVLNDYYYYSSTVEI